ncbi:unnamed protein product [Sphagnum compactum]
MAASLLQSSSLVAARRTGLDLYGVQFGPHLELELVSSSSCCRRSPLQAGSASSSPPPASLHVCAGRQSRRRLRLARKGGKKVHTQQSTHQGSAVEVARQFDPEIFDPSKLTVRYRGNSDFVNSQTIEELFPRTYTLTHSDVTRELFLSIGPSYDSSQLKGWYTQLMRDEIVAEWRSSGQLSLHVHCHVSGGHMLMAPAAVRNRIFEQEMPLVLQAIRYGDGALLAAHPELDASTVWVHFHSCKSEYNRADCWGPLFYAASSMNNILGGSTATRLLLPVTPKLVAGPQEESVEIPTLAKHEGASFSLGVRQSCMKQTVLSVT